MAKERLSKLQKWILKKCYEQGKNHYSTDDYSIARITLVIWRTKEYLETEEVKKYFEEVGKAYKRYINEEKKQKWFRYKFEISTTNSIKNLYSKGYIKVEKRWLVIKRVRLTDKGIKAVKESLKIKKREVNDKR
ncbi:hypothetical protein ES704_03402 [subsurface metagenome]|jgi:hypothetical protein